MSWLLTSPVLILLCAGGLSVLLGVEAAVRRRTAAGAVPLGGLAFAAGVWSFASALELLAGSVEAKILWSKIQYFGIVSVPVCWVWFAAEYGRQRHQLAGWRRWAGLGVPVLTLALVWTNEWHGLIWPHITPTADGQRLIYAHGLGFGLFLVYTYLCLLLGSVWIWRAVRQVPEWYRGPAVLVLAAVAIPWLSNVAYLLAGARFAGVDPTPLAFLVAGSLIALSVYRWQFLDLVPVARNLVMDQMAEGVVILDRHERVLDLNPAARRWLGADSLGRPATLVIPQWAAVRAAPGTAVEVAGGSDRRLAARLSALPDAAGSTAGWVVVLHDITERQAAEAALRDSEARLRQVIDLVPHLIFAKDADGRYILANQAMAQVYGLTVAELLGQRDADVSPHLAGARLLREQDLSVIEGGRPIVISAEALTDRDGHTRIFHKTKIPFKFAGAGTPAVLGVATDITELKRVEAALRESEQQHRLLAENASDVIWTMSFDGRLTYVSPSVEQLRGFRPEAVIGQTLEETVAPSSLPVMMEAIQVAVQEVLLGSRQPVTPRDVELRCQDGGTVWTEVLARVMYDDAGRPAGILGVSRDISARRRLEAENQGLMEAAQRRAMEAETLREAAVALATTLDLDELIPRILVQLQRVVPYDSASVQLLHDGMMEIVGGRGFADLDAVLGVRFPLDATTPDMRVFNNRAPVILADAPAEYPAFREAPHNHIRGWLGVPLLRQEQVVGMLALDSTRVGAFSTDHARLAAAFAATVVAALEQARLFQDVQRLAVTDPLTGVNNRRQFLALATLQYELACRYRHPLSVLLLDIDHFKAVNDRYGHLVGDRVLQLVAGRMREALRRSDLLGRYGGEEFIGLLPETAAAGAQQVAERVRALVGETPMAVDGAPAVCVTVSVGVVTLQAGVCRDGQAGAALQALIACADQALYAAKGAGRDQVVIGEPPADLG